MTDYWLCGWRVASEVSLPELLPWSGGDRPADVVVTAGHVPRRLEDLAHETPVLQVAADATCRLDVPGVGAFLLLGGRKVIVAPAAGVAAPDIRAFLLGTAFWILCHQRGLLPLHASCVRIADGAVAVAGCSGAGKSTLAAGLVRLGHELLTDDITVVDPDGANGPVVLPTYPRLKLWRHTLEHMGRSVTGLAATRLRLDKYHVPVEGTFAIAVLPLKAVYHLGVAVDRRQEQWQPLRGIDAIEAIRRNVYRGEVAEWMGKKDIIVRASARVAAALRANVRLTRQPDFERVPETAAAICAGHDT